VGASGLDSVPQDQQSRYREFVQNIDWNRCRQHWHDEIWHLHQDLQARRIPHVFFNGNHHFGEIHTQHDWQGHYIGPYDSDQTYDQILRAAGFQTVNSQSWHFGADAHCFWAQYVLAYLHNHNII
jgi:hypothetical protein